MHCTEEIVSAHLHAGSVSAERMRQGEVGGVMLQGAMHMAAARLGCKRAMVGTGWANFSPWLHEQA